MCYFIKCKIFYDGGYTPDHFAIGSYTVLAAFTSNSPILFCPQKQDPRYTTEVENDYLEKHFISTARRKIERQTDFLCSSSFAKKSCGLAV